jgi:hypothetical protein
MPFDWKKIAKQTLALRKINRRRRSLRKAAKLVISVLVENVLRFVEYYFVRLRVNVRMSFNVIFYVNNSSDGF